MEEMDHSELFSQEAEEVALAEIHNNSSRNHHDHDPTTTTRRTTTATRTTTESASPTGTHPLDQIGGDLMMDLDDDHVAATLDSEPLDIFSMSIHLTQQLAGEDGLVPDVDDVVDHRHLVDHHHDASDDVAAAANSLLLHPGESGTAVVVVVAAAAAAAAPSHHPPAAMSTGAEVVDPQEAVLAELRHQRAPLVDRYHPYIRPCDTSLEDARHRLETALEQTRQLRKAFTEQVYKKYRVCLVPPPSLEQILIPIRQDPDTVHAMLAQEMEKIRVEKETEKKEAMQLNTELNKSRELLPNLAIDHAEQLMYMSAGLNLVILPEDDKISAEALRDYEDGRGPIQPSGARNRAISNAAATSGEIILARTRQAINVRNRRDSQHQQTTAGPPPLSSSETAQNTAAPTIAVIPPPFPPLAAILAQPTIIPEPCIVPSAVTTTPAMEPPPAPITKPIPTAVSITPAVSTTTTTNKKALASSSSSTKVARARTSGVISATSLLSLHPHAEQLDDATEQPTASTMALVSRGVGGVLAAAAAATSTTPGNKASRLGGHPHPESLGGRQAAAAAVAAPSHEPNPTTIPPLPTLRDIKEGKPMAILPVTTSSIRRAQQAIETVLEPLQSDKPVTNVALVHHLWNSSHSTAAAQNETGVPDNNTPSTTTSGLSKQPDSAMNPIMAFLVMRSVGLLAPPTTSDRPSLLQSLQEKLSDMKGVDSGLEHLGEKLSAVSAAAPFTKTWTSRQKRPVEGEEGEEPSAKRICTGDKNNDTFTMPVESIRGGGGDGGDSKETPKTTDQQQPHHQQQQQPRSVIYNIPPAPPGSVIDLNRPLPPVAATTAAVPGYLATPTERYQAASALQMAQQMQAANFRNTQAAEMAANNAVRLSSYLGAVGIPPPSIGHPGGDARDMFPGQQQDPSTTVMPSGQPQQQYDPSVTLLGNPTNSNNYILQQNQNDFVARLVHRRVAESDSRNALQNTATSTTTLTRDSKQSQPPQQPVNRATDVSRGGGAPVKPEPSVEAHKAAASGDSGVSSSVPGETNEISSIRPTTTTTAPPPGSVPLLPATTTSQASLEQSKPAPTPKPAPVQGTPKPAPAQATPKPAPVQAHPKIAPVQAVQATPKTAPVQATLKTARVQAAAKAAPVQAAAKAAPVQAAAKAAPVQAAAKAAPVQAAAKAAPIQAAAKVAPIQAAAEAAPIQAAAEAASIQAAARTAPVQAAEKTATLQAPPKVPPLTAAQSVPKKLPEENPSAKKHEPGLSKEGLVFSKPPTPDRLTNTESQLILQGRFHEVITGTTDMTKMKDALEYLVKVGSAVPIPKSLVVNQLKESLCSPGTNYLGSIPRDIVASAMMVWLWANNESHFQAAFVKGGRLDVDPDCKWLIQATAELASKEIIDEVTTERKDGLRSQLVAERRILASQKEIGNPNPPTEKDISGARTKVNALTAVVSCRALTKDVCVVKEIDHMLPDIQQFTTYLEEARLAALQAKAKERTLLANLIARKTTMTDSFSHAYVSSMVRAGEALGHGMLFDKVQNNELGISTMIPYDVITDERNDWEEPCKPSMGMTMGLNADAMTRRAHARAMIQKSLRKLQDKLHIKGGTLSAGPYADPASHHNRSKSLPGGKFPPASSPRVTGVKRRNSTSEPPVPPGTGSAKAPNWGVFQPRHSSDPLVWNASALDNLPFGLHTISDRPRSVSLSLSARTSDAKRLKKQKLLETKTKEELASQSEGGLLRSTLEIPWSDVADIFQRVELPKRGSSSRSTSHGHEATPLPVDGKIFAPFCRKVGELKDDELESDTEEDITEATVLQNHDIVLGRMKEKLSAYMEERQRQQERRRSRNKGRV